MQNNQKRQQRKFKNDTKESFKCLLWSLPIIFGVSVALDFTSLPLWLCILITVVIGGFSVFIIYIIREKIRHIKQIKAEQEPKKFDPFAD